MSKLYPKIKLMGCLCKICRGNRARLLEAKDETYALQTAALVSSVDSIDFEFGPSLGDWPGRQVGT